MSPALHYLLAARRCEIGELEQLLHTSTLVRQLGALVHALQKERGLSNVVLASGGQLGASALQAHTQMVDSDIAALHEALSDLNVAAFQGGHGARLFNHIAYVLQGLSALPELRERVHARSLAPDASTNAYIQLIAGLLAVVFEAADSATEPGISRLLVAMFHFMQGKELAGQERATGAAAFSSGQSDPARQQHWLHLIDAQERCFQVFADCAPPAPLALWDEMQRQSPELLLIERMRRMGCTTAAGQCMDTEMSTPWFDTCTARMDALFAIEVLLAEELQQRCRTQLEAAQQALAHPELLAPQVAAGATPDGDADDGLPEFFRTPAPSTALPLESGLAPQLGQSVLSLVQEQSQRLQAMHLELESVRSALTERKTLERAKGLLMLHRQLTESEAHKLLRQTAMNQNRRLVDVAEAVLAMAELLPPSAP